MIMIHKVVSKEKIIIWIISPINCVTCIKQYNNKFAKYILYILQIICLFGNNQSINQVRATTFLQENHRLTSL